MKKLLALLLCLPLAANAEYVGDFAPGDTVCGFFNTYQPSTGAAFAMASEAVRAYNVSSTTEEPDDDGLTIDDDFDTLTGLHQVCVDTSADGTFYAAGNQYVVVLDAGTVDSISIVGSKVLEFSLFASNQNIGAWNGTAITTPLQTAADVVDEFETQSQADPTGFHVNVLEIGGTVQTANDNGADINAILVDTAVIGAAGAGLTNLPWNASWDVEAQSEANDALVALNLDHLLAVNVTGGDVANGSVFAELVSDNNPSDWDDYANEGHSLQNFDNMATATMLSANSALLGDVDGKIDVITDGLILATGACDSGTTTTCVDAALTEANDIWKGAGIVFPATGETACVYDFVAASDTLTFWTLQTDINTHAYVLYSDASCKSAKDEAP